MSVIDGVGRTQGGPNAATGAAGIHSARPPPFALDKSRLVSPDTEPPHKKRRHNPRTRAPLQFTSDLQSRPPGEFNEDGTPSVEYIRYQSTLQLKQRWDDIFERHGQVRGGCDNEDPDDDEIHLGLGISKDPFIIRDRGVVKALDNKHFGSFHMTEEKVQKYWDMLMRAAGNDNDNDNVLDTDDDELLLRADCFRGQRRAAFGDSRQTSPSQSRYQSPAPPPTRPIDPDLQAFLLDEQRRRERFGEAADAQGGESDTESIIDWQAGSSSDEDDARSTFLLTDPGEYSASEDDLDVIDDDENEDDEFAVWIKSKARGVEECMRAWDDERSSAHQPPAPPSTPTPPRRRLYRSRLLTPLLMRQRQKRQHEQQELQQQQRVAAEQEAEESLQVVRLLDVAVGV